MMISTTVSKQTEVDFEFKFYLFNFLVRLQTPMLLLIAILVVMVRAQNATVLAPIVMSSDVSGKSSILNRHGAFG
jgi:hypothetical protein